MAQSQQPAGSSKRAVVLGHGRRMWRERNVPRCAPMDLEDWDSLVQRAPPGALLFVDFDAGEEPDIVEHISNDWGRLLPEPRSYDVVIDAVSHLAKPERRSAHYWESVKLALKDGGEYFGWDDRAGAPRRARVRVDKADIDGHVVATYGALRRPAAPRPLWGEAAAKEPQG